MLLNRISLSEFSLQGTGNDPLAAGSISAILQKIGDAAGCILKKISHSGLSNNNQATGLVNSSGDNIKMIDQSANRDLIDALKDSLHCAGVGSEEADSFIAFDSQEALQSNFIVMFDPVDGSDNPGNCNTLGTVFGIYRRSSPAGFLCQAEDFIQPGKMLVAAGYIIYGPSTMLVFATHKGVNGFTFDQVAKKFFLTHPLIQCPANGVLYSINDSKIRQYSKPVQNYIQSIQEWNYRSPGSFNARYTGCMVADLHRVLFEGGIFLHPATSDHRQGKLRLMYECNPFGFIF